eukprot:9181075-Alexandrium_andersonii.AAC.1
MPHQRFGAMMWPSSAKSIGEGGLSPAGAKDAPGALKVTFFQSGLQKKAEATWASSSTQRERRRVLLDSGPSRSRAGGMPCATLP